VLFQPLDSVTILGGQLIFSAAASVGAVAMRYEDFSAEKLYWNASVGAGLRINRLFGVQIRLGAGSGAWDKTVMPFISMDAGSFSF
jgi:hypothetical protein